jgi:NADPH-dependent ferric siderophore reductase
LEIIFRPTLFVLESLWNSSKDFRTRCCKINELTLTRNQAVRGSKPQPEPGTRTLPQRSRWAYRKRDDVSCSRLFTVRSQRLRICEVHPELRLRCDACPGAGYANGAARLDDVTLHGRDPASQLVRPMLCRGRLIDHPNSRGCVPILFGDSIGRVERDQQG